MKRGFTLIELMVVISIIGLLAAITLPRFTDVTADAKVANVQGNLASLRTSIEMFNVKNERYPTYGGIQSASSNSEEVDISSNGDLSEDFTNFYSKSIMPETPASESTSATNQVVEERNNTGGWLYIEESGHIYANLKNGNYTGDEENEIWDEEYSDPGDGENPGEGGPVDDLGSLIPDGNDSWVINENGDLQWVKGTDNGNGHGNNHGPLEFTEENTGLKKISEITFTSNGKINDINVENGNLSSVKNDDGTYTYTVKFDEPQATPIDSTVVWHPKEGDRIITDVEVKP